MPAMGLADGVGVVTLSPASPVQVFHLGFDRHEILVAHGLEVESQHPGALALAPDLLSLWLACLLCTVANIIMMTTENIGALYAGRLLIGLANGMLMTFSQLYIQESSTANYRGLFLTGFQFFTSFVS